MLCQWCLEPHRNDRCQTDAAVAVRTKGVGKGGGTLRLSTPVPAPRVAGTNRRARETAWEDLTMLLTPSQGIRPHFFEPLAKTGGHSIPLCQQVLGIRVPATEPGKDIIDDVCFARILKLVQEVDRMDGTPVSFPIFASWKDPQLQLADSTTKRFAALVQFLHRRNRHWRITNPRDCRLWDITSEPLLWGRLD